MNLSSHNLLGTKYRTKKLKYVEHKFGSLKYSQFSRLLCLRPFEVYRESLGSICEQEL